MSDIKADLIIACQTKISFKKYEQKKLQLSFFFKNIFSQKKGISFYLSVKRKLQK